MVDNQHRTPYHTIYVSHTSNYPSTLQAQWDALNLPNLRLIISSGRDWCQFTILNTSNVEVARARVSQLAGCASVAVSSRGWVIAGERGAGLGKKLRLMNQRALKEAGFSAELTTVRRDNRAMTHIMTTDPKSKLLDEQPSDHGGIIGIWRTTL